MKNTAVLILDLDKLDDDSWKQLWTGSGISVHKIKERSLDEVTAFLDSLQEKELEQGKDID